jgi:hypothetical protein
MCTCGKTEVHPIARRRSADGYSVVIWSDGGISGHLGLNTIVRPSRGEWATQRALDAAWLFAGECELYEWDELKRLARVARDAVKKRPATAREYVRAAMSGAKFQAIKGGRVVQRARVCDCPQCETKS